jgi:hypothetical protein
MRALCMTRQSAFYHQQQSLGDYQCIFEHVSCRGGEYTHNGNTSWHRYWSTVRIDVGFYDSVFPRPDPMIVVSMRQI